MRLIPRVYTRLATEMSVIRRSRNSASRRLQKRKNIKQNRNTNDVKTDVKFQTKVREHLYSCWSWRSWLLTLTPFVRVRILLPLPKERSAQAGGSFFLLWLPIRTLATIQSRRAAPKALRVWILLPLPHWYTGYDTIACVLFCVSTRENPWYKGKARQVGANLHLPASHFWFFRFLHSGWKPQICTHPLHFLAFLKIRQKVQIWPQA